MSEAFLCDRCGDYYDGEPAKKLYEKQVHGPQGVDYAKVMDLCEQCHSETLGDNDE